MPKYLQAHLLKPLDVILLKSPCLESMVIKTIAGGPYSHAAVVISRTLRFESNDAGIYFTPITFCKAVSHSNACHLYEDISRYPAFDVYRHPAVASLNEQQLQSLRTKLIADTSQFNFLEYPPLEVFEKIVKRRTTCNMKLYRAILAMFGKLGGAILPGPFCSQLVAEIFAERKVDLFDQDRPSDTISPRDLASSRLQKMSGVIVDSLPHDSPDKGLLTIVNRLSGRLRKTQKEYLYTALKLRQAELLRRTILFVMAQKTNVDLDALPAATTAIADAMALFQESDFAKVQQAINNEDWFMSSIAGGLDLAALKIARPELVNAAIPVDFETEANRCLAPIRKLLDQRSPGVYVRLKRASETLTKMKKQGGRR